MIIRLKKILLFTLILGLSQPLFSQEKHIKGYFEKQRDRKFCFYPSTLRMVNISNNEAYNEMVSGVNKLLIYTLDSTARANDMASKMIDTYRRLEYDEYVSMVGGSTEMMIYGKDDVEAMVGYFSEKDMIMAFYLDGVIEFQKIPTLFNTLKENDLLDVFNLTDKLN